MKYKYSNVNPIILLGILFVLSSCDSNDTKKVLPEKNYSNIIQSPLIFNPEPAVSRYPYKECFFIAAEKHKLDAEYLAAIASVESSFNPLAESSSNAIGLMQIQWPGTAQELGVTNKEELYKPCNNIDLGAKYIVILEDRFNSKLLALSAYFEGPTKVSKTKTISTISINYIDRVLSREKALKGYSGS
tara:strand:- start:705 stop:1268 length:564 start_codon:yes stop_codon:yes gene_type:complete